MANPVNTVTYAGFTFPYARLSVDETVIYDTDEKTQIGTSYRYTISGTIGGVSQTDLQTNLCAMRQALNTPKQPFSVQWTGDSNITLFSVDATTDTNWGPKPGNLSLFGFSGGRVASYVWTLDCQTKECGLCSNAPSTTASSIESLTREFAFEIDHNGFTKRTVSGHLIVTSAFVSMGKYADTYRGFLQQLVQQPLGYQRTQQDFRASSNGRQLDFTITDQEVMWVLPQPVTGGYASFSVKISPFGARQDFLLRGRFEAPASHGKDELIQKALLLANQKIGAPLAAQGYTVIPGDIEFTEDVYNNAIDFSFAAWSATTTTAGSGDFGGGPLATFGGVPTGSENKQGQLIGAYGHTGGTDNSGQGSIAPAPVEVDGCIQISPGDFPTTSPTPPFSFPPTSQPQGSDNLPGVSQPNGNKNPTSEAHGQAMWLEYHEEVTFHFKNNVVVIMPKIKGGLPIFQQTKPPELIITQHGYAVRMVPQDDAQDFVPQAPGCWFDAGTVTLLDNDVTASSGEPVSNTNWDKYKIKWTYVMQYNGSIESGAASLPANTFAFPDDPRRTYFGPNFKVGDSQSTTFKDGDTMPNLIVEPQ